MVGDVLADQLGRPVSRPIVDDHDVIAETQSRHRAVDGLERGYDEVALVVAGDEKRDVELVAEIAGANVADIADALCRRTQNEMIAAGR